MTVIIKCILGLHPAKVAVLYFRLEEKCTQLRRDGSFVTVTPDWLRVVTVQNYFTSVYYPYTVRTSPCTLACTACEMIRYVNLSRWTKTRNLGYIHMSHILYVYGIPGIHIIYIVSSHLLPSHSSSFSPLLIVVTQTRGHIQQYATGVGALELRI